MIVKRVFPALIFCGYTWGAGGKNTGFFFFFFFLEFYQLLD